MMYWPKMITDITTFINGCVTCKRFPYRQSNEPLIPRTVPEHSSVRDCVDVTICAGVGHTILSCTSLCMCVCAVMGCVALLKKYKLRDALGPNTQSALIGMFLVTRPILLISGWGEAPPCSDV